MLALKSFLTSFLRHFQFNKIEKLRQWRLEKKSLSDYFEKRFSTERQVAKMNRAFVETETGWLSAFAQGDQLVVPGDNAVCEQEAVKSLSACPGDEVVKRVFCDTQGSSYNVLVRSDSCIPEVVSFGPLQKAPKRGLEGFFARIFKRS